MKFSFIFLFALILLFENSLFGQFFTIEDIETGRHSYLEPASLDNLLWLDSGRELFYKSGDSLLVISWQTPEEKHLLSVGSEAIFEGRSIKAFEEIINTGGDDLYFRDGDLAFLYNARSGEYRKLKLPEEAENTLFAGSGGRLAYTYRNNVYMLNSMGETIRISNDSVEGIVNGEVVYRNEFGITRGMFWSPEANFLAWYRKDERRVEKYPIVDINHPMAKMIPDVYPMAGRAMEGTEVWIYSVESQRSIRLLPPEGAGEYMTNLSWTADEEAIYVQHLNRGQDSLAIIRYSPVTGKMLSVCFTEVHPKYVEPLNPLHFLKSGDFLYQSERDGYNHLYLYRDDQQKLELLTSGDWDITEFLGTDPDEELAYFMATEKSPLESHLYSLNLGTKEIIRLTREEGTHQICFSKDRDCYIDQYSNAHVPNCIQICSAEGEVLNELIDAPDPVAGYQLGETITGTVTAADGSTELYYKMIKPVDFDPGKKYPLILYVYNGPHVQLITNSWMDRIDYLQQYFAQKGYVCLMVDGRGSDNRGREFEDVIFRQHGVPQMEDQVEAIRQICSESWIDQERIGVHGWSYGGFMTIDLMLNYPDIFRVGVAGGPVTDWALYEVMYGERYMDSPAENPEGYANTNLVSQAGKLQGDLMIIHGALDDVVVWQNSLLFIQECIKEGVQVDMFVYPDHKHNVAGKDRVHLTRMITDYFLEKL